MKRRKFFRAAAGAVGALAAVPLLGRGDRQKQFEFSTAQRYQIEADKQVITTQMNCLVDPAFCRAYEQKVRELFVKRTPFIG